MITRQNEEFNLYLELLELKESSKMQIRQVIISVFLLVTLTGKWLRSKLHIRMLTFELVQNDPSGCLAPPKAKRAPTSQNHNLAGKALL